MAMKKPNELYAITELTYRDNVHRPKPRPVLGSSELFSRITFAEDAQTALMLTLPNLRFLEFKKLRFQVWKLQLGLNSKVLTPMQVSRRYSLPHAFKYGEWVSFRNQRLEKDEVITITQSTPFEDIVETANGVEKIISRKYLF
jgi:hypothetical protein